MDLAVDRFEVSGEEDVESVAEENDSVGVQRAHEVERRTELLGQAKPLLSPAQDLEMVRKTRPFAARETRKGGGERRGERGAVKR